MPAVLGLPCFDEVFQEGCQRELLFVAPLVAAGARVVLAVKLLPLADAVVYVPGLAYQGLAAGLAHST
jgi:hypothetical protein